MRSSAPASRARAAQAAAAAAGGHGAARVEAVGGDPGREPWLRGAEGLALEPLAAQLGERGRHRVALRGERLGRVGEDEHAGRLGQREAVAERAVVLERRRV